ncbi:MAG: lipopolysaccharide biosynthesis protein [Anaerolineaceae bacterium]
MSPSLNGTFFGNVAVLVGGTSIAQAISLLIAPLVTRLYTPVDYGIVAVFTSLLTIIAPISSLRYEQAILLPDDDIEGEGLLSLSLMLTSLMAVIIFIITILWGKPIAYILNVQNLLPYFWLFPLGLFGSGTYLLFYYWALRKKAFTSITRTKLDQSIYSAIIQISLGYFLQGPLGLLIAQLVASVAGIFRLKKSANIKLNNFLIRQRIKLAPFLLKRYRKFALFSTPSAIINNFSIALPPLLFSAFYSSEISGQFALASKMIFLPLSFIGYSIGNVLFSQASQLYRDSPSKVYGLFVSILKKLLFIMIGIFIIGAISPYIFPIIFGHNWNKAGTFALSLSLLAGIQIISLPLSCITIISEKLKVQLLFDFIRFFLSFASLFLPYKLGYSDLVAVSAFSITNSIIYCISLIYYLTLVRKISKT